MMATEDGGTRHSGPTDLSTNEAYDIVQAVRLSHCDEASIEHYRKLPRAERRLYHERMAAHFRTRAQHEPRLVAYFLARAVLHDECAKHALQTRQGMGEELAENLNRNVLLEVLDLIPPPS